MTTTTWGGGTGDWFVDANWLDSTPPGTGTPTALEQVFIRDGAARIENASLDNIRLDLETATPSSGVVPHLQLVNATLGSHFLIETNDKYKPAGTYTYTGGQSSQIDIGGTVDFGGLIGFAQNFGYVDITDLAAPSTFHLLAGGIVSNTVGADMHISTTTLVNDGTVAVRQNILTIDSANVSGAGLYTIDNAAVMRFGHAVTGGTVSFKTTSTTAELELDDVANFGASIIGMHGSNAIHLVQTNVDAVSYAPGVLTLSYGGITVATLALTGDFTPTSFTVTQLPNFGLLNDVLITACFAEGTRIATSEGEIPVESLRIGAAVATPLTGGFTRVIWIGHRGIDLSRHPRPALIAPVRIRAHAFAPAQPARDLLLSPDHAVWLPEQDGGALVPVGCLINGATIVQEHPARIRYFHIELERHAVLLAEGLPAESYLDTGNRSAFANAPVVAARPDFTSDAGEIWAARACAPQQRDPARLATANTQLHRRAGELGHSTTHDPAPRLLADGVELPIAYDGATLSARLPPGTRTLTLLSRAASPLHSTPGAADPRRLGLAITRLLLDRALPAEADFGPGWHAPEPNLRWTDGAATLAVHGATSLELTLAEGLISFWRAPPARRAAAA